MAIRKVLGWFSKPGKGLPQVPLKNFDGTPILEDGNPVIGNEQFQAEQLTDDSVSSESPEAFMEDVLTATDADLKRAADCFREGWNRLTKRDAGGLDPYQKAAKGILKLGLPNYKGMTVDQVAELLRQQSQ